MLLTAAGSSGVLDLSILFSFAPLLLTCLFSIFKQIHTCEFLKVKVSREKGSGTDRMASSPRPSPPCLQAWAVASAQLSQCATLCKSKIVFFNDSPSEHYGAGENISHFLQPAAVGVDGFLCIDPGGIIQITSRVFTLTIGYSIEG